MRASERSPRSGISLNNGCSSVLHSKEIDDADVELTKQALHRRATPQERKQIRALGLLSAMAVLVMAIFVSCAL